MGRRFRPVLDAGEHPLMSFDRVESEIDFSQGRPDFVGVASLTSRRTTLPRLYARLNIPSSHIARALTVLERDETIAISDLAAITGVSLPRARRIVQPLERIGAICTDAEGMLRVVDFSRIARPDLWAFELKLDDWKRCLFQTMICRSYARRVTAVFPISKARHIASIAPAFESHGIGVMLFDVHTLKLSTLVKTAVNKPLSAFNAWMSCFEISAARCILSR